MAELTFKLEVKCADCGSNIELEPHSYRDNEYTVAPCSSCMGSARDEGDREGYERAKDEQE